MSNHLMSNHLMSWLIPFYLKDIGESCYQSLQKAYLHWRNKPDEDLFPDTQSLTRQYELMYVWTREHFHDSGIKREIDDGTLCERLVDLPDRELEQSVSDTTRESVNLVRDQDNVSPWTDEDDIARPFVINPMK